MMDFHGRMPMSKQDALQLLEEMLELGPHTLKGPERLRELEAWDSLSTMMFIATVDKKFGVPVAGNCVIRCQTVDDLCALLNEVAVGKAA
jgi:acyl carrier protein